MNSRLKNLYKYLIENRKSDIDGWHRSYREFGGVVEGWRGERLSTAPREECRKFLERLLYEKSNGVASRGQSVLSKENFEIFIKNTDFVSRIQRLINEPNHESYKNFEASWKAQDKTNNPVLINRVAAACTLNVSTTVDSGKFNQVYNWLVKEKIIEIEPSGDKNSNAPETGDDWYSKNVFLMEKIHAAFAAELSSGETDKYYLSQFVWLLYQNISNPFSLKKQVIKYGAPGTGKTFQAKQQTSLLFDIWKAEYAPSSDIKHEGQIELVQFHPSYSYEDFIEGLRPKLVEGVAQLSLQNGVFKKFCCRAGKWEIDVNGLDLKHQWGELKIEDLIPYNEKLNGSHWEGIFALQDKSKLVSDAVPPFFFIIDEINRAELSRVFGELMYCLEYRGVEGRVKTQYAELNTPGTAMLCIEESNNSEKSYQFFIPNNVYLIGTMNTVDRSVESFDFALRRRFRWEEVSPDTGVLQYYLEKEKPDWVRLAANLDNLNKKISEEVLLGHDYEIGHAYLMNLKYADTLSYVEVRDSIWEDSIRPLLQEYLRGTGKSAELIGTEEKTGTLKKAFESAS